MGIRPSELRKFRKEIRESLEANAALDREQSKAIRALKGRVTTLEKAMKADAKNPPKGSTKKAADAENAEPDK